MGWNKLDNWRKFKYSKENMGGAGVQTAAALSFGGG
jgi:hypothetical protein